MVSAGLSGRVLDPRRSQTNAKIPAQTGREECTLPNPAADIPPVDIRLNRLTLAFCGDQAHLEKPFLAGYFKKYLNHLRFCHGCAIFFYSIVGLSDTSFPSHITHLLWIIRYGMVVPVFVLGFLVTYTRYYERFWQQASMVYVLVTGGGFMMMSSVVPPPLGHSYYAGVLICLVFGYTFIRERFIYASVAGNLLVAGYILVSVLVIHVPGRTLFHDSTYVFVANFLGMLIAYSIELSARRDFFLTTRLSEEQRKVRQANVELEMRVAQRTAEILKANEKLKSEMAAHLKAEKEKRQLEVRLQQARKMEAIGTLAGGVAHDLNNILSGIVSYPELLIMDLPPESHLRKPLLTMKRSGEKAAAIVQDLLTLARRGVAVSEAVDLNRIVAEYLESPEFEKLMQYHPHIRIKTRLESSLPTVVGSPVHLSKCLMNLVSNAAEAMPVEGQITICTRRRQVRAPIKNGVDIANIAPGRYVILSVTDTGTGISTQDLERIFEPFYTKKVMGRSGTGLGMAVVWGTVKDHSGFIDIDSTEGRGTTFTLFFPASETPVAAPAEHTGLSELSGSGESILVVDDMPEQREIASSLLKKLGYQVATAASGEEAVDYLKTRRVDLLVLDMIMDPGIDGLETYRRILELHPGQRAVIASGFSETVRIREIQQLGGGGYIKKPYSLEKIGKAIKAELQRNQDGRQATP